MNSPIPRLSRAETLILELLSEGDTFGLELVGRSNGRLKRGTVYVTLSRMQDKGYVKSRTERPVAGAIGLPRRLYQPTPLGLRIMHAWTLAARAFNDLRPQEI